MALRKGWILTALVLFGAAPATPSGSPAAWTAGSGSVAPLSVMTYNVKGLPWPVAIGRSEALRQIGDRLSAMRAAGRQPHVVALQEAFIDEARSIGKRAGYAYVAAGPGADSPTEAAMTSADRAFLAEARWTKGETEGKFLDSGLEILSDYPIRSVRRAAFPGFACAGYDCLANKGILLVTIEVPGLPVPIEVLTTHLNSRHASGVPDDRSLYAYRRQVEFLERFVFANHSPVLPLILTGDFNMGPRPARQNALLASIGRISHAHKMVRDGLGICMERSHMAIDQIGDARWIRKRGRDWQFLTDGAQVGLEPVRASVLFGRGTDGGMLSDHMGYSVDYRLRTS